MSFKAFSSFKEYKPILDVSFKIKCLEKHTFSVENGIVVLLI